jgi:hypothetical protein
MQAKTSVFVKNESALKQPSLANSNKSKVIHELPAKNVNPPELPSIIMSKPYKKPKIEEPSEIKTKSESSISKPQEIISKPIKLNSTSIEIKTESSVIKSEPTETKSEKSDLNTQNSKVKQENTKTSEIKQENSQCLEIKQEKSKHSSNFKKFSEEPATPVKSTQKSSNSKKSKDDLNQILSNKNLYNTEEDDETYSPSPVKTQPVIKSSLATTTKLIDRKIERPASKIFENDTPLVHKRKVMKTRTLYENGKIVSEDYSSEEEVILQRPTNVIGKKEGVQMKLNFFKK